jgi:hypothetical protein
MRVIHHDLKPVMSSCPACRDGITSQRLVLAYRRIFLCESHVEMWDAADANDRAREQRKAAR